MISHPGLMRPVTRGRVALDPPAGQTWDYHYLLSDITQRPSSRFYVAGCPCPLDSDAVD